MGKMVINMKVIIKMDMLEEKEFVFIVMVINMKVIGKMVKEKEKEQ